MKTIFGENFPESNIEKINSKILPYILFALHTLGGSEHGSKVVKEVGKLMCLSEEMLNKEFESRKGNKKRGQFVDINTRFSMSALRKTGYIKPRENETSRGFWSLTSLGEETIEDLLSTPDSEMEVKVGAFRNKVDEKYDQYKKEKNITQEQEEGEIEEEVKEEESMGVQKYIDQIVDMDPFEFERLCVRVLRACGADMQETKRTGDNGIDGVGNVRSGMITFRTVMQAKRYALDTKVNEKEMRDFLGAIKYHNAEKGIFITTSAFAPNTEALAEKHSITLIDGDKLVGLMQDNAVGFKQSLDLDNF